jgi:hypothetical protein
MYKKGVADTVTPSHTTEERNKRDMKNIIAKGIISIIGTLLLVGVNGVRTDKAEINTQSIKHNIEASHVQGFETEIYYIKSQEDYDRCTEAIEQRNGKIIIEVIQGTVIDDCGNGRTDTGDYIRYDGLEKGTRVETVLIYDPATNYIDDIMYRADTIIK